MKKICYCTTISGTTRAFDLKEVNNRTWIGAGATMSNNISVCDDCLLGAGAVVVKDIKEKGTYIGVPVQKLEYGN